MRKPAFLVLAIGLLFTLFGCPQPTDSTPDSYTITFNANGGTGPMEPQTIVSGSAAALCANTFTRTGYSFAGWAISASGSVAYANGASYAMGNSDVALYAVWSTNPSFTITFNANGGTGTMYPQTIGSGFSVALSAISFTNDEHVYSMVGRRRRWRISANIWMVLSISWEAGMLPYTRYGK